MNYHAPDIDKPAVLWLLIKVGALVLAFMLGGIVVGVVMAWPW